MNNSIAPSKELGYSSIFLDFLAGSDRTRQFYPSRDLLAVAAALDRTSFDRDTVARILLAQNERYRAGAAVLANIERLRDPRSLVVIAGQQAGLFGGPLLVLIKALSVVKAARRHERELGRPIVPMFWIAADDHDFAEVNHSWLLDRSGRLQRVSYDAPREHEYPIGQTVLAEEPLFAALHQVRESLGDTDFTSDLYQLLEDAYQPGVSFDVAFGRLLAALTAEYGLVFFSPADTAAKRLMAPFFGDVLAHRKEMAHRLADTNAALESHGYHLQVEKSANAAHLFYAAPDRTPLSVDADGTFTVSGRPLSEIDLRALLETEPERFSPDVFTRPVMQSMLFPVLCQLGGAAEIAYLAQINRLFELFGRVVPHYEARATATILESRHEKQLDEYGIEFGELFGDIEQVINRVLARSFPEEIEGKLAELRGCLDTNFDRYTADILSFDPGLKSFAEQVRGKIDYQIGQLEAKAFASHKKKSQQTRDRIYRIQNALAPNRAFQERSVNAAYFVSKYGRTFVTNLFEHIDVGSRAHHLISLTG